MNKYKQLKDRLQKEWNALPVKYEFGSDQFNKMMLDFGHTKENPVKVISIGYGGYIRADDEALIDEFLERSDRELLEAMRDDAFLYDAFNYELSNHEFCYTDDITDTLDALGLTWEQIKDDKRIMRILKKACEYQYDINAG